jgi:ApbE superfamily uncharacterized protein (UPF0280 family)
VRGRAQVQRLGDGRLFLHDGPIDLIVEAFGAQAEVRRAYDAVVRRFVDVLDELCAELAFLRCRCSGDGELPQGMIAQRMTRAVAPYAATAFITPMAAVAGAVAEEILAAMTSAASLERSYVNDGGDIAIHLTPGRQFRVGMVERPERPSLFGTALLTADAPVRGIASSGWRGRSFSLGIADAVTILAETAAQADAAATIVANAVDLPGHAQVTRLRARDLAPDNDLGDLLVTQDVGPLEPREVREALDAGEEKASSVLAQGLICAAALRLRGETRIVANESLARMLPRHDRSLVNA